MAKAIFREDGVLTEYGTAEAIRAICVLKPLFADKLSHEAAALLHLVVEEARSLATEDARAKTCATCGWHRPKEHARMRCGAGPGGCLDFHRWKPREVSDEETNG